jgi:ribosomal protein S27AE
VTIALLTGAGENKNNKQQTKTTNQQSVRPSCCPKHECIPGSFANEVLDLTKCGRCGVCSK